MALTEVTNVDAEGPAGMSVSREHEARARARAETEKGRAEELANLRQTVAPATDRYADGALPFISRSFWIDDGNGGRCRGDRL